MIKEMDAALDVLESDSNGFIREDASEECELDIITLAENEKLFEDISFNT